MNFVLPLEQRNLSKKMVSFIVDQSRGTYAGLNAIVAERNSLTQPGHLNIGRRSDV
jgi:hypothetical protein